MSREKDQLPIAKKAYKVNLEKIEEGYMYSDIFCHASNINQAKSALLKKSNDSFDLTLKNGEDVSYTTIPILRAKEYDLYLFEGKEMYDTQINDELQKRERNDKLDTLLNNADITHCYISKGSYYRPNSCGYTDRISEAGIYTKEVAVSHARSCRELDIIPIDIKEHNQMILGRIEDLKSRLIN